MVSFVLTSLGRVLEHSLAANIAPHLHDTRIEGIAGLASPLKRSTASALLKFATKSPRHAHRALDSIARTRNLRYLDAGADFSAYLRERDGVVVKIHRESALLQPDDRKALVAEMHSDHERLTRYLGCSMLSQEVEVAEHVLGGYQAVQIHQPYIDFSPEDSPFQTEERLVSTERVEAIARKYANAEDELLRFAERSLHMFDEAREVPDTNGRNNVVMTPMGIALIDSVPIKPDDDRTQGVILAQLSSLQAAIREVV